MSNTVLPSKLVKSNVRHSILTALALDAYAYALSEWPEGLRIMWNEASKTHYPKHRNRNEHLNGKCSNNGQVFIDAFSAIAEFNFYDEEDSQEAAKYVNEHIAVKDFDNPLSAISVGLAIAYYLAVMGLNDIPIYLNLVAFVFNEWEIDAYAMQSAVFLGFLVLRMFFEGFFCSNQLVEALTWNVVPESLVNWVYILLQTHLDADWLRNNFSSVKPELSPGEREIAHALFLMCRVGTAYDKTILNSLPRGQINDILRSEDPTSLAFIFGALCTASEHKHPLIQKPMRETVEYKQQIDEALAFC